MKVLYYVNYPLAWAKGGHAIQIHETIRGIRQLGIETAWIHPEDRDPPTGDIVHYFSRPPSDAHWQMAKQRGMKIVVSELHQQAVLRPRRVWRWRGLAGRALPLVIGRGMYATLGIDVYHHLDAAIAVTPAEADYMRIVMRSPPERTHFVPNGVDDVFFDEGVEPEPFDGLLYVAYICERKNSLEVARAAKQAGVPVKFVGAPAIAEDRYARAFAAEVDNRLVFWEREVTDRRRLAAMFRGAPGSFLASRNEAVGLSLLESLATGTPVLVPDLPNLREYFGEAVGYIPGPTDPDFAPRLRAFHQQARGGLRQDFRTCRWSEVAQSIAHIYKKILSHESSPENAR